MSYTPTTWTDNTTPLSAENMNHAETQYSAAMSDCTNRRASVMDYTLPDTNLDTVATYTPSAAARFRVDISYRVVTATTNVTLEVSWSDASGAQTFTIINAQSTGVGSWFVLPATFTASGGAAVTVKAQASAADQVAVSASIVQE